MNEGQETCTQYFGGEFRRLRYHLENQGVFGGIVLTWTFKNCNGLNIDWIDLTQALMNVVMC